MLVDDGPLFDGTLDPFNKNSFWGKMWNPTTILQNIQMRHNVHIDGLDALVEKLNDLRDPLKDAAKVLEELPDLLKKVASSVELGMAELETGMRDLGSTAADKVRLGMIGFGHNAAIEGRSAAATLGVDFREATDGLGRQLQQGAKEIGLQATSELVKGMENWMQIVHSSINEGLPVVSRQVGQHAANEIAGAMKAVSKDIVLTSQNFSGELSEGMHAFADNFMVQPMQILGELLIKLCNQLMINFLIASIVVLIIAIIFTSLHKCPHDVPVDCFPFETIVMLLVLLLVLLFSLYFFSNILNIGMSKKKPRRLGFIFKHSTNDSTARSAQLAYLQKNECVDYKLVAMKFVNDPSSENYIEQVWIFDEETKTLLSAAGSDKKKILALENGNVESGTKIVCIPLNTYPLHQQHQKWVIDENGVHPDQAICMSWHVLGNMDIVLEHTSGQSSPPEFTKIPVDLNNIKI